jgi:hypothetical protein
LQDCGVWICGSKEVSALLLACYTKVSASEPKQQSCIYIL